MAPRSNKFPPLKTEIRSWPHNPELSSDQILLLDIFLDELMEWNRKMNLSGLSSRREIIDQLLMDSMMPCPFLPEEGSLLDIGSGAGFPAIPLKICRPRLKTLLIEPNSKKVGFLKHIIRITKLHEIGVIRGRIQDLEHTLHPEGYEAITSRGLARLPQFLAWCTPYLKPGGLMVAFQGSRHKETLRECADIIKKERLFPFKSIPYSPQGKKSSRNILILKKHG